MRAILSFKHETLNRAVTTIVEVLAEEMNIDIVNAGSTTFKREDLARGFEPDTAFYIQNAERVRGKDELDLKADQVLVYELPKPMPDGRTALLLTPLELLNRLASLIPPPRRHRHRYHGVLAANSSWRAQVTALAGRPWDEIKSALPQRPKEASAPEPLAEVGSDPTPAATHRPLSAYLWAVLVARIYELSPLLCTHCGTEMKIIAFVTDPDAVTRILKHIGEPSAPPAVSPARGPPAYEEDFDQTPAFDPSLVAPTPAFEFDKTVTW